MSTTRRMNVKFLKILPFQCGVTQCPKHKDAVPYYLSKKIQPEFDRHFNPRGCAQYRTAVYGLSEFPLAEDEWERVPLFAAVLPAPDPTGIQGVGNGAGVTRDLILESMWESCPGKAVRVAIVYLTRGYSVKPKAYAREPQPGKINEAAISFCSKYMIQDLEKLQPQELLLCGKEVGFLTHSQEFSVPDFRRYLNHTITLNGKTYPAQVTFDPYECIKQPSYIKVLREDCRKLFEKPVEFTKKPVHLLTTYADAVQYLEGLRQHTGMISFDVETRSIWRKKYNPLGTLQFATSPDEAYVLPWQHKETSFSPLEMVELSKLLTSLFKDPIKADAWVAHGAKFENTILQMHFGTMLRSAPILDTQGLYFLLDETRTERKADKPKLKKGDSPFSLKLLAKDFLYFFGYDAEVLAAREEGALLDMALRNLADYGGMDAYVTFALLERALELASEQGYLEQMLRMAKGMYSPATRLVAHIEMTGFKTRLHEARKLSSSRGPYERALMEYESKLKEFKVFQDANLLIARKKNAGNTKNVFGQVPWVLDLSKPEHKKLIFFEVADLEPVSFTDKTGEPSVDDEFYEAYRKENPMVEIFAQYEETKKMRDTFINKIIERIDPETGDDDCKIDQRIRTNIHYTQLVTQRWGMSKPNLQQLPRVEEQTEEGQFYIRKAVKDLFTVDDDCGLIQVDYKVNEVRWAAILAWDEEMARIFNNAAKLIVEARATGDPGMIKKAEFLEDIHRNTASAAFDVAMEQVTKQQRTASKSITFGILFQQGLPALAEAIKVEIEEAQAFQAKFFSKMKGIATWIETTKYQARTQHFIETPIGQRRRFWAWDLPASYPMKGKWTARNERQAVNTPIQGTASWAAMMGGAYSLLDFIETNDLNWKIQNVVHDSTIIQTPKDEIRDAIMIAEPIFVERAQQYMEDMGVTFNLPLGADVEAGHVLWGSLDKWIGTEDHAVLLQKQVIDYWDAQHSKR